MGGGTVKEALLRSQVQQGAVYELHKGILQSRRLSSSAFDCASFLQTGWMISGSCTQKKVGCACIIV